MLVARIPERLLFIAEEVPGWDPTLVQALVPMG